MIKIKRIQVRVRGDGIALNHHQAVQLARDIGQSLAGETVDDNAKIDSIRLSLHAPKVIGTNTLANEITNRIMTKIGRR